MLTSDTAKRAVEGKVYSPFTTSGGTSSVAVPTDEEQVTGLEWKTLEALKKGVVGSVWNNCFQLPQKFSDHNTHLPQVNNSAVIWFCMHEGSHCCPSCGAYYKLVHHELPH
ncbi:PREDICTED: cytochrome c oxidase subunit 5B, mitochondrial [Gavialis gangeticus]|uniref:cytochrome c oxidase subunit 5B, mitochondrial n=1 Tax=Gavialis gangeticus TaxID=94835 RepID=UPI00092F5A34|nr:PREDICTED: cytochrome c oxidase subunit 5B, mitochondrial [Gavialis gangeticus]